MSRVLIVGKGAPERGGIAAFLSMLMSSDLTAKHDVRLLNLTRESEPQGGKLNPANVRRTAADAAAVWRAAGDRDVVHIHSALAPLVTLVRASLFASVARSRGVQVILHAHGGRFVDWSETPWRRQVARALLLPASVVVPVASSVAHALRRCVATSRIVLIPNGVDTDHFSPGTGEARSVTAHRPPRILYAGHLTPRKGVLDLLEASARLERDGVVHELWVAGGTPDEGPEAERRVREAATGASVHLLGSLHRTAMADLYRSADIFCLPSWWEAMPLTVLEAMATGLPIVATDVGDVGQLVEDGASGYLVPPRSPGQLADRLAALLTRPALARRMGDTGRRRVVADFDLEHTLDQLDHLYSRLSRHRAR
jgi:glycosyltransferase involved in cell wall biosynthesis